MTARRVTALLYSAVLSGAVQASAQPAPANLLRTHFNAEAGLPGSIVDRMAQTPDGFLWLILSEVSLVRFDGKHFHEFANLRPFSVAAAPDGGLWIGTRRGV